MSAGALYLLPAPLAEGTANEVIPGRTLAVARRLDLFFAESARSARAYLKSIDHPRPLFELEIIEIGHQPEHAALDGWLDRLQLRDGAIVPEGGCPAVADPGATLVARAHQRGILVRPLVGPSSILLALMASGLNGQSFRFVGYLPQDRSTLASRLRELERASRSGETQVWIETPYRSERMLEAVLGSCRGDTLLSVAIDLTAGSECIRSAPIAAWNSMAPAQRPPLHRRPAVFALLAGYPSDPGAAAGSGRSR